MVNVSLDVIFSLTVYNNYLSPCCGLNLKQPFFKTLYIGTNNVNQAYNIINVVYLSILRSYENMTLIKHSLRLLIFVELPTVILFRYNIVGIRKKIKNEKKKL